jgi:hypothetical protein
MYSPGGIKKILQGKNYARFKKKISH